MTDEHRAVVVEPWWGTRGPATTPGNLRLRVIWIFNVSHYVSGQFTSLEFQMCPSAYALPQCIGLIKHLLFTVMVMFTFSVVAAGERLQEEGASRGL